jgi:malate synthase
VTADLFRQILAEELQKIKTSVGEARFGKGRYIEAAKLFSDLTTSDTYVDFLTLPGYELLG